MFYKSPFTEYFFSIALVLTFCFTASASPDDLDASFGTGGKVFTNIGEGSTGLDRISKIAGQPDGKYILAGIIKNNDAKDIIGIVRLNADGTLDRTFGQDGKVRTDLPTVDDYVNDVLIQPDGKIVAAGSGYNYSPSTVIFITLVRYNADGSLDNTFDGDGIVQTNFSNTTASAALSAVLQPDGKIVAAGTGGNSVITTARFNADGSPDTTYGDGTGKFSYRIGNNLYNRADGVALQPDGKIVTTGTTKTGFNSSNSFFQVSRLNSNGSIDASFNGTGSVTTAFNGNITNNAVSVAVRSDGRIVALGSTNNNTPNSDFALLRVNSDGTFDTSFDGDGRLTTNFEISPSDGTISDDRACDLGIQPDGRIVAGGYARIGGIEYLSVIRYNADGSLDASFDGDGKQRVTVQAQQYSYNAGLIVEDTGKIVIAGRADVAYSSFAAARFNSDGSPDAAFGGTTYGGGITPPGISKTFFSSSNDSSQHTVIQADGKILVGGLSDEFVSLARYNPNGSLDNSFGDRGRKKVFIDNGRFYGLAKILPLPDGKIIITGTGDLRTNTQTDFMAARLNSDGSRDVSFGNGGVTATDLGRGVSDIAYGAAIQNDGKIILAGETNYVPQNIGGRAIALVRYNADGSPDTSFGINGKNIYDYSPYDDLAEEIVVQPDGKIMVAGTVESNFLLARFNPNGSIDTSFNATGVVVTDGDNFSNDAAKDLYRLPDGKFLVTGTAGGSNSLSLIIVKYNSDGTIDASFGSSGRVLRPLDILGTAEKCVVQQNGKIIVAGRSGVSNQFDFNIYRFNPDGSSDISFGENGRKVFDLNPSNVDQATSAALQTDGKIVVSGSITNNYSGDFAVIRLLGDRTLSRKSVFDFDGDGKTDVGIFRPSTGAWWISASSTNVTTALGFGAADDKLVPADYTGDGKSDVAFFRPSTGQWFVLRSEDYSFYGFGFGASGDIPVPGDFDGDGKTDAAVFRPSNTGWYILRSSDGGVTSQAFGASEDRPVVADYDGDDKADIAIFRPSTGAWWIQKSGDNAVFAVQFGSSADKTVPGDYTGDGKADIAYFRPSNGTWYILRSENFSFYGFTFGASEDLPVPGDYDGDGKTDAAVFRPSNSSWYLLRSTAGFIALTFGTTGDSPVPNSFVR